MSDLIPTLLVGAAVFVVFGIALVSTIRRLFFICGPNEVLVFSGAHSQVGGKSVGYRIVKGGSSLRIPLLEKVDRLDLTNVSVDVAVTNAYSKGGIPLHIHGVANLKIAGHQPLLHNAIERFLGVGRDQITRMAKDTLEGNLRGVTSQLTPEEVNTDKLAFAEKLLEEAEHDLSKLGLVLDVLKIQTVADDVGYLNSLGRKQSAELDKRARIAEAEAKAESAMRAAENRLRSRSAQLEADMAVARATNQTRVRQAESGRAALAAEAVGQVTSALARAEAELEYQKARIEQVRLRLAADVVAPARAASETKRLEAAGNASRILEDGRASVESLRQLVAVWKEAGPSAREVFLAQKLPTLASALAETIGDIRIDRLSCLPHDGVATGTAIGVTRAIEVVEKVKGALGVDLGAVIGRLGTTKDLPPGK